MRGASPRIDLSTRHSVMLLSLYIYVCIWLCMCVCEMRYEQPFGNRTRVARAERSYGRGLHCKFVGKLLAGDTLPARVSLSLSLGVQKLFYRLNYDCEASCHCPVALFRRCCSGNTFGESPEIILYCYYYLQKDASMIHRWYIADIIWSQGNTVGEFESYQEIRITV